MPEVTFMINVSSTALIFQITKAAMSPLSNQTFLDDAA